MSPADEPRTFQILQLAEIDITRHLVSYRHQLGDRNTTHLNAHGFPVPRPFNMSREVGFGFR